MDDLKGKWNRDKKNDKIIFFIFLTILIISGVML